MLNAQLFIFNLEQLENGLARCNDTHILFEQNSEGFSIEGNLYFHLQFFSNST